MLSHSDAVIRDGESLLDLQPESTFALKNILLAASKANYNKLAIFISDEILATDHDISDLAMIARAFLNEKILDKASKIAKEALEIDPDNEEIKDILWQASVEKHTNTSTPLVTAEDHRFVPPKIDTNKIFISSHKEDKNSDSKKEKKKS